MTVIPVYWIAVPAIEKWTDALKPKTSQMYTLRLDIEFWHKKGVTADLYLVKTSRGFR